MNGRGVVLFAALVSGPFCAQADDFNKAGRTAFQFVKIGIGARQTAVGEAGIAFVRDVNAAFWNPAGISGIQNVEGSFSYNRWLADLDYIAGSAGIRWPSVGIFAVSYASLKYGDIQEALVRGAGTSSDTRTGNTFTGEDLLLSATFAREFSDRLAIGVTVKYLREKLFVYSTDLVAFDVGTYYDTGFNGIRFGMSFQNFGKSVRFLEQGDRDEEGYDIPLLFRVGASVDVLAPGDGFLSAGEQHRLSLMFEALNTNDFGERYHVGGEYVFMDFLALRGGYRFNYDEGNLSLGAGISQTVGGIAVRVDYSFVRYEFLDSPSRFSVSLSF